MRINKRIFDIVASFWGIIILSPFLAVIAVLIRIRMSGPVLFRQKRIGRHGKPFTIYKFRTMVTDHDGGTVSVLGDSRISPLGAKLRRKKLDELPELWNVLIGDMSFVGPRPDMPEYLEKLSGEEKLILELRPGITGPATLKYANEEEILASQNNPKEFNDNVLWPDKVKINLEYYKTQSFYGDISLIMRTIFSSTK